MMWAINFGNSPEEPHCEIERVDEMGGHAEGDYKVVFPTEREAYEHAFAVAMNNAEFWIEKRHELANRLAALSVRQTDPAAYWEVSE